MSTHKYFDKICCVILALTLLLTVVIINADSFGIKSSTKAKGYETRIFDTSKVHTIDIVMDDWDGFIKNCTNEEYVSCAVVIDNESYKNVAMRAKGNTSLSSVRSYGNDRYSFKIEFDHYDSTKSYHGLDKLSLNNIIQDNTYIKDYLVYQLMGSFGADAPLCSFVQIKVNGEEWGLYLAVEGVEDSFLERNYGKNYGELYKPDSMSMGGGRGNGGKFNMDDWQSEDSTEDKAILKDKENRPNFGDIQPPDFSGMQPPELGGMQKPENGDMKKPEGGGENKFGGFPGGNFGVGMGADDVKLIYTDDNHSSYSNIFENAKTDITDADKDRLISSLKRLNENSDIENTVNIEEVIRYFVVHNFVCNFDSYTGMMIHNYYLYENSGKLSMIPWDYNLAFGGFIGGSDSTSLVNFPIDSPVSGGTVDSRPMLSWIFKNEEYIEMYHRYFSEFIESYFENGYFSEMIASLKEMLSPYVQSDPTKFCTYEDFEKGIDTLKEFCLLRAQSVKGQLSGTIPSTSEGQAKSKEALIDASTLNISDMGSMGKGMGGPTNSVGGKNDKTKQPEKGDLKEEQSNENPNENSNDSFMSGGATPPQSDNRQESITPPDFPGDGGFPPGGAQPPDFGNGQGNMAPPDFPSDGSFPGDGSFPPDFGDGQGGMTPPEI